MHGNYPFRDVFTGWDANESSLKNFTFIKHPIVPPLPLLFP
jgi:hypothetical protein